LNPRLSFRNRPAPPGGAHELGAVEVAPHCFHLQPEEHDLRPKVPGFLAPHPEPKP